MFLALAVFNQHDGGPSDVFHSRPAMLSSNQAAASAPWRNVARLTNSAFDWTNNSGLASNADSFLSLPRPN